LWIHEVMFSETVASSFSDVHGLLSTRSGEVLGGLVDDCAGHHTLLVVQWLGLVFDVSFINDVG
jgi:hypothetical protein